MTCVQVGPQSWLFERFTKRCRAEAISSRLSDTEVLQSVARPVKKAAQKRVSLSGSDARDRDSQLPNGTEPTAKGIGMISAVVGVASVLGRGAI